jgi:hypothetical protein
MKRIVPIVVSIVLVAVAAVWFLLRGPGGEGRSDDVELALEGQFLSDSLGVGLLLPPSPGWSFERPPFIPGGPYLLVMHESGDSFLQVFVHEKSQVGGIDTVIERRRDQLAASYGVDDIESVIEQILAEGRQEFDSFPAWQWQALTEPVDVPGDDPAKVMFLVQIVERHTRIFEFIGRIKVPLRPSPEEQATNAALVGDLSFVMQSVQAR